jgi:hypothetical protein
MPSKGRVVSAGQGEERWSLDEVAAATIFLQNPLLDLFHHLLRLLAKLEVAIVVFANDIE